MSKIDQFAENVTDHLAELEETFGDLNARAREVKERGKDIAHAWSLHFDAKVAEINKAEQALQRLSNVPLPPSSPGLNGQGEKKDDKDAGVGAP